MCDISNSVFINIYGGCQVGGVIGGDVQCTLCMVMLVLWEAKWKWKYFGSFKNQKYKSLIDAQKNIVIFHLLFFKASLR